MKKVLIFLSAVLCAHALERGRDYERDKVCRELAQMGRDDFRMLSIVLYSRKFPSGSFEQISHLINEVVSLTETCCAEGADPDCYDNRTSALSAKSCESNSPFPVHPGTPECCAQEGLEQKLCMAALKHPPQEFPTYTEPTNDEICEAFSKDPKEFAEHFLYEYSINYGQAPLPLLIGYTKNYLSMVGSCCTSPNPTVCFLKERLQIKQSSILTTMSNRLCSQHVAYGQEKSRLSHIIKLAQKLPTADLKDILPLAEGITAILSNCCESASEDCMAIKLPEHTENVCDRLSTKNSKFKDCCQEKTPMDIFVCIYFMQPAQSPDLPDIQFPQNKDVCSKGSPSALDRYTYEVSRKTHLPEVFLSKILEPTLKSLADCCHSADSTACFNLEVPLLKKKLATFIEKGQELCADYSENTFTEYKKKLAGRLKTKQPDATDAEFQELLEKTSDFASKCCSINSPPLYCNAEIEATHALF